MLKVKNGNNIYFSHVIIDFLIYTLFKRKNIVSRILNNFSVLHEKLLSILKIQCGTQRVYF